MTRILSIFICLLIFLSSCAGEKEQEQVVREEQIVEAEEKQMTPPPGIQTGADKAAFVKGQFEPSEHPDFTLVEPQYANKEGMYLHEEAYDAFKKMYEAAQKDGIILKILSAARNFDYQKNIWENKWSGKTLVDGDINLAETYPDPKARALMILRYSAMPGTSRHHWGTEVDLNALNNEYFASGEGLKVYQWLTKNAPEFGFCQPYTEKDEDRRYGYDEEKWHWSYKPLASRFMSEANSRIQNDEMEGFSGAELAEALLIKEKFILGVNKECR